MTPDHLNNNATEKPGVETGLPPEPSVRAAVPLQAAVVAALQGDLSSDIGPADETTLSQEELAGLSSQFAERGIDLGSLLGMMMEGPIKPS